MPWHAIQNARMSWHVLCEYSSDTAKHFFAAITRTGCIGRTRKRQGAPGCCHSAQPIVVPPHGSDPALITQPMPWSGNYCGSYCQRFMNQLMCFSCDLGFRYLMHLTYYASVSRFMPYFTPYFRRGVIVSSIISLRLVCGKSNLSRLETSRPCHSVYCMHAWVCVSAGNLKLSLQ